MTGSPRRRGRTGSRGPEYPLTRAELARRHGVDPSAVTRAFAAAHARRAVDPTAPAPPKPVNAAEPDQLKRWLPSVFDPWWRDRPRRGRPRTLPTESG